MIKKTIYRSNLISPDSVTVEVGEHSKTFKYPEENKKVAEWVESIWNDEFFRSPAYVY